MNSRRQQKNTFLSSVKKQAGIALILMIFIIGLMITAVLIKSFNAASAKERRNEQTMLALGQAKDALLAWSVSHPNWPGVMPFPDRGNESSGAGYDGKSDCVSSGLDYPHLIGKLALLSDSNCISPQHGIGKTFLDASGEVLWYAVSRNLIRTSQNAAMPVINPGIVNSTSDWLSVFDTNGNLISDRVAAVIIAPGSPLAGQIRNNTASPANYLDAITIGGTDYSNATLSATGTGFYFVTGGDVFISNTFNDRLVFITIDELIAAVEKRVVAEVKNKLEKFYLESAVDAEDRYYPFATPLGVNVGYSCALNNKRGFLPIEIPPNCSYQYTKDEATGEVVTSSSCGFDYLDEVIFSRINGNDYNSSDGGCTHAGKTCSCNTAGKCTTPAGPNASSDPEEKALVFSCDAVGNCLSQSHINNQDSIFEFMGGRFDITAGACSRVPSSSPPACLSGFLPTVSCVGDDATTTGTFSYEGCDEIISDLPPWFRANLWQDYLYYAISRDGGPEIRVGDKQDIEALLISTGAAIINSPYVKSKTPNGPQARPSCEANDYLDSELLLNTTDEYDAIGTKRSAIYNDQIFVLK